MLTSNLVYSQGWLLSLLPPSPKCVPSCLTFTFLIKLKIFVLSSPLSLHSSSSLYSSSSLFFSPFLVPHCVFPVSLLFVHFCLYFFDVSLTPFLNSAGHICLFLFTTVSFLSSFTLTLCSCFIDVLFQYLPLFLLNVSPLNFHYFWQSFLIF